MFDVNLTVEFRILYHNQTVAIEKVLNKWYDFLSNISDQDLARVGDDMIW